jgi:hypothetical protein
LQVKKRMFFPRQQKQRQQQQQHQSCPFCDPARFPPLMAVFPRLRRVSVDVAANRESGLVWRAFCKAAVQNNSRVWVACTGVGEGVLQDEERNFGMKICIVDGRLKRVWEIVRRLEREEVRGFVEDGMQSDGVREAMRVFERVADGLLRLFWFYDAHGRAVDHRSTRAEAGSLAVGGEDEYGASSGKDKESQAAHCYHWLNAVLTENGSPVDNLYSRQESPSRIEARRRAADDERKQRTFVLPEDTGKPNRPLTLRWTCHRTCDFLTPLNWALRVWLKRNGDDESREYVKVIESGGVKDVFAAEKMKAALLEEFGKIPQRSMVCGSL